MTDRNQRFPHYQEKEQGVWSFEYFIDFYQFKKVMIEPCIRFPSGSTWQVKQIKFGTYVMIVKKKHR